MSAAVIFNDCAMLLALDVTGELTSGLPAAAAVLGVLPRLDESRLLAYVIVVVCLVSGMLDTYYC